MAIPASLSTSQAKELLKRFGHNRLVEKKPPSPYHTFLEQIKSPLVYILLFAGAVTAFLGDYIDTGVILFAVSINTFLGFFQEHRAQRALHSLKTLLTPKAKVFRDGLLKTIPSSEIVPGDIVQIRAGDKIPADGRILESKGLFVNEAILTGESVPVEKSDAVFNNLVAMGTVVSSGRGRMIVTETGKNTSLGKIAETLKETVEPPTPLQIQISELARMLALLVLVLCTVIFTVGILTGQDFLTMFTTAVAIAVSAIPEGMMVSLTAILAIGMQRILKQKAIVRNLVSAEVLGSVTTICVDKTGTLTEGIMKVVRHTLVNESEAAKVAILANNMEDPTEVALWDWARSLHHTDPAKIMESMPRTDELPFDHNRKLMAVATGESMWVKGAPEILLAISNVSEERLKRWQETIGAYGHQGLRMIALAYKKITPGSPLQAELHDLEFIGIVGVSDPVRSSAKNALELCRQAKISIKVITGDFRSTAESVLTELGIRLDHPETQMMDGNELEQITPEELKTRVRDVILFFRVSPHHKLKIVEALQNSGEIVAMTGDGVNDALALKKAEVAIVVAKAPDVAQDNADIVLLDSNFGTIVHAIEEGRAIFQNIRKVVLYLLSDVFLEMVLIVSSLLLGLPLPLTASQILWINILSDGFPGMALAFEPKERHTMNRPPLGRHTPIVNRNISFLILLISLSSSIIAMIVYVFILTGSGDLTYARTITFVIVGTKSLFYVFSTRTLEKPFWKTPLNNPSLVAAVVLSLALETLPLYHRGLNRVFDTVPMTVTDWILVVAVGVVITMCVEGGKYLLFRKRPNGYGQ